MNEVQIESIVAWLSEADRVLEDIKVETSGIVGRASAAANAKERQDLLNEWTILANGVRDVANAAVHTIEEIVENANRILSHIELQK